MSKLLTKKQVKILKDSHWDPIPTGCWLSVYPEDGEVFDRILKYTKADFDPEEHESLDILIIGTAL